MFKKIIYITMLTFFITSCSDSFSSVKRGLTGAKKKGGDEFMVRKKDPLILPPDFQSLPTPDQQIVESEEISLLEKKLKNKTEINTTTSKTENSILQKIRKK
ncbi:MAG: Protein of unknown function (DUF3035) [Pelagibacterales bacterium]|nr:Protein of unknown function (DUF3035) [Pelagibacterales bacterium]